ncbi:MAG: 16S rRNA (guanine(966)-N(2))-methyltransferase RsmD [Myxococcales bacterium]|nr:16S rRNA (guanine(966)-N(2))-methyltransferase RsmD [Myxococcales bacterium]
MRVIAGSAKGRTLHVPPAGTETRPTTDKVREALFNVLGPVDDLVALDLFAGTGALGIEALSRGARSCAFVEASDKLCATIRRNLADCRFESRAKIAQRDVRRFIDKGPSAAPDAPFDLVFMDPPYMHGHEQYALDALVAREGWLREGATVVVERATRDAIVWSAVVREAFGDGDGPYEKEYGDTTLVFWFAFGARASEPLSERQAPRANE